MDWDKLRIFHAVAEAGSFTHAGNSLNLSQSAVSRQISTLEESLGVSLFHRHARGLILTEEGEILSESAQDIFAKMAMLEGRILDSKEVAKGPLRVTTARFIGTSWLSPKLADFKTQHPEIQISVLLRNEILNLSMREADVAIRLFKPDQPDLIQRHLTKLNFHICASKKYLEEHGTPKSTNDLKKHILIGHPDNLHTPFPEPNWILNIAKVDLETNMNLILINSIVGAYEAAQNDAGIAVLPEYMIRKNKNLEVVLENETRDPVDVYFVYPEERKHSKRISIFRDFLLKNISVSDL